MTTTPKLPIGSDERKPEPEEETNATLDYGPAPRIPSLPPVIQTQPGIPLGAECMVPDQNRQERL